MWSGTQALSTAITERTRNRTRTWSRFSLYLNHSGQRRTGNWWMKP